MAAGVENVRRTRFGNNGQEVQRRKQILIAHKRFKLFNGIGEEGIAGAANVVVESRTQNILRTANRAMNNAFRIAFIFYVAVKFDVVALSSFPASAFVLRSAALHIDRG